MSVKPSKARRNKTGAPKTAPSPKAATAARPAPSASATPTESSPASTLGVPQQRGVDGSTVTRIWLGAAAITILLTILLGTLYGPATGVLVLVTAVFCAVIALFWSSLRTLLGETVLQSADAFAIGAPGGEDEQKRAVLRALKDLEFERSVGKISEADYRALVVKLRARAKDLLRQLDAASAENRARAEALLEERLRQAKVSGSKAEDEAAAKADADEDEELEPSAKTASKAKPPTRDDEDEGAEDDDDIDEASGDDDKDAAKPAAHAEKDGDAGSDKEADAGTDDEDDEDDDAKESAQARGKTA
ncbi:MAG: hypothetical protein U0414_01965 [Polyangiaceae bacterium]